MEQRERLKTRIRDNWLVVFIAAQPLLDIIAYWTRSSEGTISGYIRLCVLLALPLYILISLKKKKSFIISMLVIGVFCALHVLNGFRVGYIDMFADVAYIIKTIQMPVLAICFIYLLREEQTRVQAEKGLLAAVIIVASAFLLAVVTGTANSTYGEGFGLSGWVISDNRCANSIILVTLSSFAVFFGVRSDRKLVNILVPLCVGAMFIINGTKACYGSLFALFIGYSAFIVMNRFVNGEKIKKTVVITLALLSVVAVVIYPYTPRAKVSAAQSKAAQVNEIEVRLSEMGYDVSRMTVQERFDDPVVRGVYEECYRKYMYSVNPYLFDRFGSDKLLMKYNMSYEAKELIDTRIMKQKYASLIWDETDTLTKLVGFEFSQLWGTAYDLENDWTALFYYYGYIGVLIYAAFVLWFFVLIVKRLLKNFAQTFNLFNFALLICVVLLLGLAQFSGALLRRPNSSVYLSVLLALVYFRTTDRSKVLAAWGESAEK